MMVKCISVVGMKLCIEFEVSNVLTVMTTTDNNFAVIIIWLDSFKMAITFALYREDKLFGFATKKDHEAEILLLAESGAGNSMIINAFVRCFKFASQGG